MNESKTCAIEGCDLPAKSRGWCAKHYQRWYNSEHADVHRANARRWQEQHPEKVDLIKRGWLERNPDHRRAVARKWARGNADVQRETTRRYRARRRSAPTIPFSLGQLQDRMRFFGNRCWICGGPQEAVDHVKPVAKGGWHALANLRPICKSCNSSKNDRWPYQAAG